MRIYDSSLTGAAAQEAARTRETQDAGASGPSRTSSGGAGQDHVEFSSTLSSLSRAVSCDQASRASRIQALTAQVQNGTYQANAQAISRGLVSEALGSGS